KTSMMNMRPPQYGNGRRAFAFESGQPALPWLSTATQRLKIFQPLTESLLRLRHCNSASVFGLPDELALPAVVWVCNSLMRTGPADSASFINNPKTIKSNH